MCRRCLEVVPNVVEVVLKMLRDCAERGGYCSEGGFCSSRRGGLRACFRRESIIPKQFCTLTNALTFALCFILNLQCDIRILSSGIECKIYNRQKSENTPRFCPNLSPTNLKAYITSLNTLPGRNCCAGIRTLAALRITPTYTTSHEHEGQKSRARCRPRLY